MSPNLLGVGGLDRRCSNAPGLFRAEHQLIFNSPQYRPDRIDLYQRPGRNERGAPNKLNGRAPAYCEALRRIGFEATPEAAE
jgi:hypothetical protein